MCNELVNHEYPIDRFHCQHTIGFRDLIFANNGLPHRCGKLGNRSKHEQQWEWP